ncbi:MULTISPECIES: tryptophan 2,3-dioxygenase [unclassified Serratia (in: enterobacteria)]|uniref:tryptophan 2,3-dioxygenase n=1 Tax=unclassified Serratia (in: enterobacteria) TaxID=2647522 RepID=UPI00050586F6|nr:MULTISPECIES: tryptophan 2,3-dioxygenase [unclassified Serratia (in: enterobacteria)]KFK96546.1 tryptophan 2,3-dioxygenase [Serratia sp. Ag2]KFK99834.1 tryptophan 2,3-dioxygenase [Serratia sp. Ag1]
MNQRELEGSIVTDFSKRMSYGDYLCLDQILLCQQPLSNPQHHDEMLFIVQHQTSELWMKLMLHELQAARRLVQQDKLSHCFKILARVKQIQRLLFEQWAVLETLTPSEYVEFRGVLGNSSGFQSHQYRSIEFLLGNKNAAMLAVFNADAEKHTALKTLLEAPSLYDEFLRYLSRHGFSIPQACVERDWTQPYQRNPELLPVFKQIYDNPQTYWEAYEMAEKLVDIEESFHLWRFRHMKTVERIIGFKSGTGGSSGVSFLKKALELTFFPELLDVRTEIGA